MHKLDEIVFLSALAQARRLMKQGHAAKQAAEHACTGAWVVYRERVLNALLAEQMSDDRE